MKMSKGDHTILGEDRGCDPYLDLFEIHQYFHVNVQFSFIALGGHFLCILWSLF